MPKFEVQVIETDDFGWSARLEETVIFQTEEAALAFQKAYNTNANGEQHSPEIDGNVMVARPPKKVSETEDDQTPKS